MAQKRSTRPTNTKPSARRSTSSKAQTKAPSKTPKKAPAPKAAPVAVEQERSGVSDWFHAFSKTRFFKPLLFCIVALIVFGLDLLISWNAYDRFFKLFGIELIVVALIFAIKIALTSNKKTEEIKEDNDAT